MKKKYQTVVLAAVFCCTFLFPLSASDRQIAKAYLKRAMANREYPSIAAQMLAMSKEYADQFPEYCFLQLENCRQTGNYTNAAEFVAQMLTKRDKAFLLNNYDIDRQAAQMYRYLHEYKEALPFFKSIISVDGKKSSVDYLEYLSCLFAANVSPTEILPVLQDASRMFSSAEIVFYQVLYSFAAKEKIFGEPERLIRQLENNGYAVQETQYLRSFLVQTEDELEKFLVNLEKLPDVSEKWGRDIIYRVMEQHTISRWETLDIYFSLWKKWNGNNDIRTFQFLSYAPLANYIRENQAFSEWVNYTGDRLLDSDDNGRPEMLVQVKDGVIIKRVEDKNQDGIAEKEYLFHDDGKIDRIYIRENNQRYLCYNFNRYDSVLLTVETWQNNVLTERAFFDKGSYVFMESSPLPALEERLLDYREEYPDGQFVRSKFSGGRMVLRERDFNADGTFESRETFQNGVLAETFIDMDNDGVSELHNIYKNGKLVKCEARNQGIPGKYNYQECFLVNGVEKYWDNDGDGIYEIMENTLNNGTVSSYFDIDHNGSYDYLQERGKNGSVGTFWINPDKTKKQKLSFNQFSQQEEAKKNWMVISSRNAHILPVPDSISFTGDTDEGKTGTFSYQNQKFYFSDGHLKSQDFCFRLLRSGEMLFLFDCQQ